ncbi:Hypothetical predicted protein, partial [Paramuricea clavata]
FTLSLDVMITSIRLDDCNVTRFKSPTTKISLPYISAPVYSAIKLFVKHETGQPGAPHRVQK